jgi:hypothetical protein
MTNGAATIELIQTALKAGKIVMINRFQFEGAQHAEDFFVEADGSAARKSGNKSVSLKFANVAVYVRRKAA